MPTRPMPWLPAVVLALAAACARGGEPPAAPATGPANPRALLKAFFAEEDAARRAPMAAAFGAVAPKPWAALKAMFHECAPRPDLAPGRHEFRTPGGDGIPPVRYVLRVPAGYLPHRPQGYPLVLCTHGTGGSGDAAVRMMEGLLGPDVENVVLAGPDSPQPGVYEAERLVVEYPLHVLADVRRRANVDADRVVLTGYSRGGYTTWGTALFSPGEWAGAMPMASWPLTEAGSAAAVFYLPNVLGLSIQAHWGAADIEPGQKEGINTLSREAAAEMKRLGAKRFEGVEYAGQGHDLKLDAAKVRGFIAGARREPFPTECRLIFHRLYQGRACYVRATAAAKEEFDFRAARVIKVTRKEDFDKAKRALWLREGYELTCRLPEGKNLVAVFARNLKEIEIELAAERLDFGRPIRITLNGRTASEGARPLDWAELLETARRTHDFERLIGGRVRLTVPSR